MNKTYTFFVDGQDAVDYGSKKTAVKYGDESGKTYQVHSPSGAVVHAARVDEPEQLVEDEGPDMNEGTEFAENHPLVGTESEPEQSAEPMTKAEAFSIVKEARVALRKADDAIKDNRAKDLLEIAGILRENGSAIFTALTKGSGIRGMR